jgi:hypothetical protein
MSGRQEVTSLQSVFPKFHFFLEGSDCIVMGNDVCVSSLQLQIKVTDSQKYLKVVAMTAEKFFL